VGNTQIVLGGILLLIFVAYIVLGLTRPGGFQWEVFTAGGAFFPTQGVGANLFIMLRTVALIYVAYVGFEVIADDAEEVENPTRNIPLGILISLTLVMVLNILMVLVTLGTVPWQELAGSETALTDAVRRFLPGLGVPLMALAGIIATLNTINTSMLSASREAFTLSRDGTLPRALSRLGRFRTPYISILTIGAISCLVAIVGLVDFLAYISSAGYLFVLFWASLAMTRLRKRYPDLKRPFKVPFFPLTAYLAAATGFLVIAFTKWQALLFGVGVVVVCSLFYSAYRPVVRALAARVKATESAKDRILVPVAHPRTAKSLVHLAAILAQASEDTNICVLTVAPVSPYLPQGAAKRLVTRLGWRQKSLHDQIVRDAQARNVPLYTKIRAATSISQGILEEAEKHGNVKLILMGWPGPLDTQTLPSNPANEVLMAAHTNFAVLLDRGLKRVRHILVPVGGGPHSRLAISLAYEIAEREEARITVLRLFSETAGAEEIEDEMLLLREIIEDELGSVPACITLRVARAESVPEGILEETTRQPYDLIVVGASEEWASRTRLFGSVDDWVADKVSCSVLMVRRYEPVVISWLRRQVKRVEKGYPHTNGSPPGQEK
jgi:nucleotide-binding universal stress UspA family protein